MKKSWFLILSCIVFVLFIVIENILATNTITGQATAGDLALQINIVGTPSLNLISPENRTYLRNSLLLLNFTSNGNSTWYNLDGGSNTSLSNPTLFSTTTGQHTLLIFSNNSYGLTTKNITFTTNPNLIKFHYSEYNGSTRGSSTDFINYSYEALQNFSGVTLENTDYGKIQFYELINLTNDFDLSDGIVDLDSNTEISENNIEINSTALPNFNKQAILYLYGLSFTNPRILKDGVACDSSVCTEIGYTSGTFVFNVTEFSVYSAEETPEGEIEENTGSSGGGGGALSGARGFSIDKEEISISLKKGQTKHQEITITNTGTTPKLFVINIQNIDSFIRLSETSFIIPAGEPKTITLDFIARETANPGLYPGKLIISAGEVETEILIGINVNSLQALFDVSVEIPDRFKKVPPGEDIFANVRIFNLGEIGRVDAEVIYMVKDLDGNILFEEHETLAVETQAGFGKEIHLPESVPQGNYILQVRADYEGQVASSSTFFEIANEGLYSQELILYAIMGLFLITIIAVLYEMRKIKKEVRRKHRVDARLLSKRGYIKRR